MIYIFLRVSPIFHPPQEVRHASIRYVELVAWVGWPLISSQCRGYGLERYVQGREGNCDSPVKGTEGSGRFSGYGNLAALGSTVTRGGGIARVYVREGASRSH